MKLIIKSCAIGFITFIATSCIGNSQSSSGVATANAAPHKEAKYIFYFIGDGMTTTQVRLAEAALTIPEFQYNYSKLSGVSNLRNKLYISQMSTTGLATTNARNRYITCSAAAATALATGNKTNVGIISQSPEGDNFQTIAEMAKSKGMKVGVVSSVSIDHATPACFYAHSDSRSNYAEISDQLITSGFDYFAGGSVKWNSRATVEGSTNAVAYASYRARAEANGFKFVTTRDEFDMLHKGGHLPVIATLNMLSNECYVGDGSALPYTIDLDGMSDNNRVSLADFTAKGAEILYGKSGFFMMIEGGKIDWACHANDATTCAYEVVAFDEAVGVALDFAAKHPDETLIVITGDHDCGGLSIGFGGTGYESAFNVLARPNVSFKLFTTRCVGKLAAGASFQTMLKYACESYGFVDEYLDEQITDDTVVSVMELSDYEVETLRIAYQMNLDKVNKVVNDDPTYNYESFGGYAPFVTTCTRLINNKAGLDFTSFSHTAVPAMVFAQGAGADLFNGYYDNTDIAKRIMKAGGLK